MDYLPELMNDKQASDYMIRAYDFFEKMKPGTRVSLQTEVPKQIWLCVAAGAFLCDGDHGHRYVLDDDYLFLICFA